MCNYPSYVLFNKVIEGIELQVELQTCECGEELEIIECAEYKQFIVQKGKVYEVGEEE